ncbi:hypothetical protein FQZ97_1137930 [compost metagenome]
MRAVHGLGLEQQVIEGLFEQGADLGEGPVVAGGLGCGGTHGSASFDAWGASCQGCPAARHRVIRLAE